MLYRIQKSDSSTFCVYLNDKLSYVVCKEASGEAWVLLGCRFEEPRPTILYRSKQVDFVLDRVCQGFRNQNILAGVDRGVLVWLPEAEYSFDIDGARNQLIATSGDGFQHSFLIGKLALAIADAKQATLGQRMDAGDASFDINLRVYFIPFKLKEA